MHLINLNGLSDAQWNSDRAAPTVLAGRQIRVGVEQAPRAVWLIDPDGPSQDPVPLTFQYENGDVLLALERLENWAILVIER